MRHASLAAGGVALGVMFAGCGSSNPPVLGDSFMLEMEAGPDAGTLVLQPTVAASDDPATCDQAAMLKSYVGCDFWPTVVANSVWSIFDYAVVVANAGTSPATVTVTGPMATNQTQIVPPNALAKFYLPWVPELKGGDADNCGSAVPMSASVFVNGGAYHLVSTVPVTVYQFSALEYKGVGGPAGKDWSACPGLQMCSDATSPNYGAASGCFSFTNDSSLLLPSTAMTGNYRVAAFPGQTAVDPTGTFPPQPVMGSYFAITATADDTTVTVQLSSTGNVLAGDGVPATAAGGTITLNMNAGDVAELAGAMGDTVDLSGSLVEATQPVQVIAGAPCDQNPEDAPACDHLEQSVFPAETLGTQYFVTVPSNPFGERFGHVVRFYGNVDGTVLTYTPAPAPAGCPATLNAGEVGQCNGIVKLDFEVTGNHEFAVGSFMLGGSIVDPNGGLGDPSQSFMAALEQYRTKYVFLAPSDYLSNWADIVAPTGSIVVLDEMAVDTSGTASGESVIGQYTLIHGLGLGAVGAHVVSASAPIGLQVLGYGSFTSYQYPGGLNLKTIAPPPPVIH